MIECRFWPQRTRSVSFFGPNWLQKETLALHSPGLGASFDPEEHVLCIFCPNRLPKQTVPCHPPGWPWPWRGGWVRTCRHRWWPWRAPAGSTWRSAGRPPPPCGPSSACSCASAAAPPPRRSGTPWTSPACWRWCPHVSASAASGCSPGDGPASHKVSHEKALKHSAHRS